MNRHVISQHIGREPNRIDDLPGQTFMAGMEPEPEPVQLPILPDQPFGFMTHDNRCDYCSGNPCYGTDHQANPDKCAGNDHIK